MEAEKRKALSMYLRDIRDPRRRQGRIYPAGKHSYDAHTGRCER